MQENDNRVNNVVEEEGLNFKKIFSYALAYWKLFLVSVVVCVAAAFVYLRFAVPQYQVTAKILWKEEGSSELPSKIYLFQGLPKSDKMELIIQKSVELGVYDITPVEMKRCVVKLNKKDKSKKIERWQKIYD